MFIKNTSHHQDSQKYEEPRIDNSNNIIHHLFYIQDKKQKKRLFLIFAFLIVAFLTAFSFLFFTLSQKIYCKDIKVEIGEPIILDASNFIYNWPISLPADQIELDCDLIKDQTAYSYNPKTKEVKTKGKQWLDCGTYVITLKSKTDESITGQATIKVIDTQEPTINVLHDNFEILQYDQSFKFEDIFEVDDKSDVELTFDKGNFNLGKTGEYCIKLYAKDIAGNKSSAETSVIIKQRTLDSISASYKGPTEENTKISNDSDFLVLAKFIDGTEISIVSEQQEHEYNNEYFGWRLEDSFYLDAGVISTATIHFGTKSTNVSIPCSTKVNCLDGTIGIVTERVVPYRGATGYKFTDYFNGNECFVEIDTSSNQKYENTIDEILPIEEGSMIFINKKYSKEDKQFGSDIYLIENATEIKKIQADLIESTNSSACSIQSDVSSIAPNLNEYVYIPTNGGTKYHEWSGCSEMENPQRVTIQEAEKLGYTPCKKCYN